MDDFKKFMSQYGGMIIGIIVAILLLITRFYELIIAIILIAVCGYAGFYFQHNKENVKTALKNFIDKLWIIKSKNGRKELNNEYVR